MSLQGEEQPKVVTQGGGDMPDTLLGGSHSG